MSLKFKIFHDDGQPYTATYAKDRLKIKSKLGTVAYVMDTGDGLIISLDTGLKIAVDYAAAGDLRLALNLINRCVPLFEEYWAVPEGDRE